VSPNHATKDYAVAPEKYAASGTGELWIFDPELAQYSIGFYSLLLEIRHAQELGLDEGQQTTIRIGAYLHDLNQARHRRRILLPGGRLPIVDGVWLRQPGRELQEGAIGDGGGVWLVEGAQRCQLPYGPLTTGEWQPDPS
jgi:hypothetical protein